jgi:hypothetical protein
VHSYSAPTRVGPRRVEREGREVQITDAHHKTPNLAVEKNSLGIDVGTPTSKVSPRQDCTSLAIGGDGWAALLVNRRAKGGPVGRPPSISFAGCKRCCA